MNKEAIYDSEISPLIAKVIGICKQHKIAMIMSFAIPTDDDPDLSCSTALLSDEYEPQSGQIKAFDAMMPRQASPSMITARDKGGNVTSVTAILG